MNQLTLNILIGLLLFVARVAPCAAQTSAVEYVPRGLTADQASEWRASSCKWRVIGDDGHVGIMGAPSAKACFAYVRVVFMKMEDNPEIGPETKAAFRKDMLIIYDDHQNGAQVCHLIPLKNPYDRVPSDWLADGGDLTPGVLQQLDKNIELQCLMASLSYPEFAMFKPKLPKSYL